MEEIDWEAVYVEYLPKVYNFFRYRTGAEALSEDLTTTTTLVEDLDQRVVGIESEMDQVKGSVERFQVFFEGLRELLSNVFTPEEINQ